MCPNDADGMANSVDPDQTAPRSSLIRVCTVCPGISVQKLRIITVRTLHIIFFIYILLFVCIKYLSMSVLIDQYTRID